MAHVSKPVLLAGCAIGALLISLPSVAAAQGLQGNGTVVTGDAAILSGAGSTQVTISRAETVINWVPFDKTGAGTINFLPDGNSVLFRSNIPNFTVLNRVLPEDLNGMPTARAIGLNGDVFGSSIDPFTLGQGNIWFYSPTGIVIGPTANFVVGSLLLTTNDIQFTENAPPLRIMSSEWVPCRTPSITRGGFIEHCENQLPVKAWWEEPSFTPIT